MALYKRGNVYWTDVIVNGVRYRESLGTSDGRKAPGLERELVVRLQNRAPDPTPKSKQLGSLSVAEAIDTYILYRAPQVSKRMVDYWREQSRPLIKSAAFHALPLKKIRPTHISEYQAERLAKGRAPKTINGEVSVLRQLLKHAKLWYQFVDDYKPIRNTRPPVGRALTSAELEALFTVARTRSDWTYAYTAATLAFFCGLRACEIKGLQWKDIDLENANLQIRRSKTPAGWRSPSLNNVCLSALTDLRQSVSEFIPIHPDHYVFPWHGRQQMIDPTKPMTSWRSAWRSILKAAGLQGVRFHDGRHTVVTTLAEKGIPDWVIQAQVGHVDPQMMKTYSHIRREALKNAARVLEPAKPKILDETSDQKL
ncbi:MAG: tyrosine-type recombinase/integrase [Pyrinomonadaceae bacterium]